MGFLNGIFTRVRSCMNDANASPPLNNTPDRMDLDLNDMVGGLNNCILRDGTGSPVNNTPWNNRKITGLAPGVAIDEAVNVGQLKASTGGGSVQRGSAQTPSDNASVYVPFPSGFLSPPSVTANVIAASNGSYSIQIYNVTVAGFNATVTLIADASGPKPGFGVGFNYIAVGPS